MPDADQQIGDELAAAGFDVSLSPGFADRVGKLVVRRHRRVRGLALVGMILVIMLGAGALVRIGSDDGATTEVVAGPGHAVGEPGTWNPMPEGPLSARRDSFAFTVGNEVVIFGGYPEPRCRGMDVNCRQGTRLLDGAAFDPTSRTWRPIAETPEPIGRGSGAVVGDRLYLWVSGCSNVESCDAGPFVAYDLSENSWTPLSMPPGLRDASIRLAPFGDQVVAYPAHSELGSLDYLYTPDHDTWTALPPAPAAVPVSERTIVAHDDDLYLFGLGLDPPGVHGAAVLRSGTDQWTVLDDGDSLGYGMVWAPSGDLLVNPGGRVETDPDDPIRTDEGVAAISGISDGGVLDTETDTWAALPERVSETPSVPNANGLGTVAGPRLIVSVDVVLDALAETWTVLPESESVAANRAAVAWVGDTLVAWGGVGDDRMPVSSGATIDLSLATTP